METNTKNRHQTRREFIGLTLAGGAAVASGLGWPVGAQEAMNSQTNTKMNNAKELFPAGVHFGLGGVPLGNEFEIITDDEAYKTLRGAWDAGVRYFDTSPWYGLGLCERRFGAFLHEQKRSDYVLSSKVGKLLQASPRNQGKELFPFAHSPNNVLFDYTADGVRRSMEDSLQRLGVESLDIVFVHDLSPDNPLLPTPWEEQFEIARKGAFPALSQMREEGLLKGWGVGVNRPEPILKLIEVAQANVCLLASQYSLLEHQNALEKVFPAARKHGMSFVVGTSLNAGFLSGSPRYNYGKNNYLIAPERIDKRNRLRAVADRHGVELRTAALQFSAAPDVAAALVVGARSEGQILADYTSMHTKVPPDFWAELKAEHLIEPEAPTPA